MDVISIETRTKSVIRVRLTDVPGTVRVRYTSPAREIQPDHVEIEYQYRPTGDACGWTSHWWAATSVKVSGSRVLKPGPNGEQRLGKDQHTTDWSAISGGDVQQGDYWQKDIELPEWLDGLISELRPSGDVALPGGVS